MSGFNFTISKYDDRYWEFLRDTFGISSQFDGDADVTLSDFDAKAAEWKNKGLSDSQFRQMRQNLVQSGGVYHFKRQTPSFSLIGQGGQLTEKDLSRLQLLLGRQGKTQVALSELNDYVDPCFKEMLLFFSMLDKNEGGGNDHTLSLSDLEIARALLQKVGGSVSPKAEKLFRPAKPEHIETCFAVTGIFGNPWPLIDLLKRLSLLERLALEVYVERDPRAGGRRFTEFIERYISGREGQMALSLLRAPNVDDYVNRLVRVSEVKAPPLPALPERGQKKTAGKKPEIAADTQPPPSVRAAAALYRELGVIAGQYRAIGVAERELKNKLIPPTALNAQERKTISYQLAVLQAQEKMLENKFTDLAKGLLQKIRTRALVSSGVIGVINQMLDAQVIPPEAFAVLRMIDYAVTDLPRRTEQYTQYRQTLAESENRAAERCWSFEKFSTQFMDYFLRMINPPQSPFDKGGQGGFYFDGLENKTIALVHAAAQIEREWALFIGQAPMRIEEFVAEMERDIHLAIIAPAVPIAMYGGVAALGVFAPEAGALATAGAAPITWGQVGTAGLLAGSGVLGGTSAQLGVQYYANQWKGEDASFFEGWHEALQDNALTTASVLVGGGISTKFTRWATLTRGGKELSRFGTLVRAPTLAGHLANTALKAIPAGINNVVISQTNHLVSFDGITVGDSVLNPKEAMFLFLTGAISAGIFRGSRLEDYIETHIKSNAGVLLTEGSYDLLSMVWGDYIVALAMDRGYTVDQLIESAVRQLGGGVTTSDKNRHRHRTTYKTLFGLPDWLTRRPEISTERHAPAGTALKEYPIDKVDGEYPQELLATYLKTLVKMREAGALAPAEFDAHMARFLNGVDIDEHLRWLQAHAHFGNEPIESMDDIIHGQSHADRPIAEMILNALDALRKLGDSGKGLPVKVHIEDGKLIVEEEGVGMTPGRLRKFIVPNLIGEEENGGQSVGTSHGQFVMGAKQYMALLRHDGSQIIIVSKSDGHPAIEMTITRRNGRFMTAVRPRPDVDARGTRVTITDPDIQRDHLAGKAREAFAFTQGRPVEINGDVVNENALKGPTAVHVSDNTPQAIRLETYNDESPGLTICVGDATLVHSPGGDVRRVIRFDPDTVRDAINLARDHLVTGQVARDQIGALLRLIEAQVVDPQERLSVLSQLYPFLNDLSRQGDQCRDVLTVLRKQVEIATQGRLVVPNTPDYHGVHHEGKPVLQVAPELLPDGWKQRLPHLAEWQGEDPIVLLPNNNRPMHWDPVHRILVVDPEFWRDHPELVMAEVKTAGMPEKPMRGKWRQPLTTPQLHSSSPETDILVPTSEIVPSGSYKITFRNVSAVLFKFVRDSYPQEIRMGIFPKQGKIMFPKDSEGNYPTSLKVLTEDFVILQYETKGAFFDLNNQRITYKPFLGRISTQYIRLDNKGDFLFPDTSPSRGFEYDGSLKFYSVHIEPDTGHIVEKEVPSRDYWTIPYEFDFATTGSIRFENGRVLKQSLSDSFHIPLEANPSLYFSLWKDSSVAQVLPIFNAEGKNYFGPLEESFFELASTTPLFNTLSLRNQKTILNVKALLVWAGIDIGDKIFMDRLNSYAARYALGPVLADYEAALVEGKKENELGPTLRKLHYLLTHAEAFTDPDANPLDTGIGSQTPSGLLSRRMEGSAGEGSGDIAATGVRSNQNSIFAAVRFSDPETWMQELIGWEVGRRVEGASGPRNIETTVFADEQGRPVVRLHLAGGLSEKAMREFVDPRPYAGRQIPPTVFTLFRDTGGQQVAEVRVVVRDEKGARALRLVPVRDGKGQVIDVRVQESNPPLSPFAKGGNSKEVSKGGNVKESPFEKGGEGGFSGTTIEQVLSGGDAEMVGASVRSDLVGLSRFVPKAHAQFSLNGMPLIVKSEPIGSFQLTVGGQAFSVTIARSPDRKLCHNFMEVGELPADLLAQLPPEIRRVYGDNLSISIADPHHLLKRRIDGRGFQGNYDREIQRSLGTAFVTAMVRNFTSEVATGKVTLKDFPEEFFITGGYEFHRDNRFDRRIHNDAQALNRGELLADAAYYTDPRHPERLFELLVQLSPAAGQPSLFDLARKVNAHPPHGFGTEDAFIETILPADSPCRGNTQVMAALERAFASSRVEANHVQQQVTAKPPFVPGPAGTTPWQASSAHQAFYNFSSRLARIALDALGGNKQLTVGFKLTPKNSLAEHFKEAADGTLIINGRDHSHLYWNLLGNAPEIQRLSELLSHPYNPEAWHDYLAKWIDNVTHELTHQYAGDETIDEGGKSRRRYATHDEYFYEKQRELIEKMGPLMDSLSAEALFNELKAQFPSGVMVDNQWFQ